MHIRELLCVRKRAAKQRLVPVTPIDTPPRPAGGLPEPLVRL
jgi:hypothetical protein